MATSDSIVPRSSIPLEIPAPPLTRQYFDILRRRIWIILAIAVIVSCVGAVKSFREPDIYKSTTRILVERQAPKVAFADPSSTDFAAWDPDFYSTQAQLLRSQPVLELAVEDPEIARTLGQGIENKPPPLSDRMKEIILAALGAPPQTVPEPWERLAGYITAKPTGGTHFLNITATAYDPRTPALLANGVARAFENFIRKTRTDKLGDNFDYLKEEKEKEEQKYLAAEEKLQAFRKDSKGIDLRDSETSPAIERLGSLNARLTQIQLQRSELKAQILLVRDVIRNKSLDAEDRESRLLAVPIIKDDANIQGARSEVLEQRTLTKTLADIYGSEHPQLQKALATLNSLQSEFNDTLQRAVLLNANKLQILQTEEAEVTEQYEEQKAVALESAQEAFKMARLEMEVSRHRELFDALVKKMLETEMSSGFDTTNVNIIEDARVSRDPVGPNRKRDIILSILLGLAIGIGLAIVIETMDDTIKTPEDLRERLELPLLGFIPQIRAKSTDKSHARIDTLFAVDEPVSSIAEAFRQIRTSLFYSLSTDKAKVVAASSCHPGEGKTTTICNLAAVIAQSGRRVLLIDGDFHRPNVHRIYGIENSTGLADVLDGSKSWTDTLIAPERNGQPLTNLHIIVAGKSTPKTSELLSSTAMKKFITEAKEQFDWVLVDSPPLLFVSDASVLGTLCDGIILVVKSGMNNRSLLEKTCAHLRQINVNILGTILNQMVVSALGRHYSYYYYHGYSKYAQDYHNSYYGQPSNDADVKGEKNNVSQTNALTKNHDVVPTVTTQQPKQLTVTALPPPLMAPSHTQTSVVGEKNVDAFDFNAEQDPNLYLPSSEANTANAAHAPTPEIDSVRDALDNIEMEHTLILEKLQSILNRRPGSKS